MDATQTIAFRLADHLQSITIDSISSQAKRIAISGIIDTIGVTLLGATEPVVSVLQRALAGDVTSGNALVFGGTRRAGVLEAAFINGTASHAADYDDMAHAMGGHPSVTLVPVIFALGEALGSKGDQVLEAYIVGFEAECRIGRVVNPDHYERGWHPTSTLGVFGAAAAGARLLRLDVNGTATALAIAASLAGGIKANFGTMTKPLHVGQCVRNGLMAAQLAASGFTGNPAALEHKQGYFATYDGLANVNINRLLPQTGDGLEVEQESVGVKQFPCCGSTHPAIRAMLSLRSQGLIPADVESIEIMTNRRRLPHTNNPFPQSALGAKFSIQYAAARALVDGPPRLRHFEGDTFLESGVRELLDRTSVSAYPPTTQSAAHEENNEMAADITVKKRDGTTLTVHAPHQLGRGGKDPMSDEEIHEKYSDCAGRLLPQSQVEDSYAALQLLETCGNVARIAKLLEVQK
ncbi:MmgE/PrpD family protein [Polaromonas sp. SM01]|uniref:MmgE/PrpD family protein n=1 Tax=Polaromonas sp. SM01 TaxID=3085630 RepID=UPI002981EE4C|nr:MmgE/PrpD family protein [Polaromonas sp. SM01]MDW5442361.1 MmgE/PrpD family protein [Polaromonas sp. SM01]